MDILKKFASNVQINFKHKNQILFHFHNSQNVWILLNIRRNQNCNLFYLLKIPLTEKKLVKDGKIGLKISMNKTAQLKVVWCERADAYKNTKEILSKSIILLHSEYKHWQIILWVIMKKYASCVQIEIKQ